MEQPPTPPPAPPGEMTLLEHLAELRRRLIIGALILVIGAFVSYSYCDSVFTILTNPYYAAFPAHSLIGTGPAEAFLMKLKVAVLSSVFLTSPLLFHQLWLFVAPGLYEHERKLVVPFIAITSLLFLAGAYAAYIAFVPITMQFFSDQYQSIGITPQITVREHLSLMIHLLLGSGAIAETPVLAYFLGRFGIITHQLLIEKARYAVVAIFLIAAVITPTPDVLTQCLFALPLLLLYGVSIGIVYLVAPRSQTEATKLE